jgi:outer membrane receptor for ferrienterochelin and colicin
MPANAIEKIEIITQPGAEFQQLWGAILNIITNKNAKNYLSATYT